MWKLALLSLLALSSAQEDVPTSKEYDDTSALDLSHQGITSLSSYDFSKYPQLEELDLSGNNIRDIKEDAFSGCPNLKKVNLSGNPNLLIPEYATFLVSNSLTQLDLSNCKIKQLPPTTFDGTVYVEEIDLSGNPLRDNGIDLMAISTLLHPKKIILPHVDEEMIHAICEEVNISIDIKSEAYHDSVACEDVRQGTWQPKEAEHPPVSIEKRQTEEEGEEHHEHKTEDGNEDGAKAGEETEGQNAEEKTDDQNTDAEPEATNPEEGGESVQAEVKVGPQEETKAEGETQPDEANGGSETNVEPETKAEDANAGEKTKGEAEAEEQDTKAVPAETGGADPGASDNKDVAIPPIETQDNANETAEATNTGDAAAPPENIKTDDKTSADEQNANEKKDELSAPLPPMQRGIIEPAQSPPQQEENSESPQKDNAARAAVVPPNQESNTGSNVLVFLVVAVVVAGLAAFGYKFYKSRKYQAARQSEPIERELKEIVTERPTPREEQPLVNRQANSVEIKEVDESGETPKDNGNANNVNANQSGNSNPSGNVTNSSVNATSPAGHVTNQSGNANNASGYVPHAAVPQEPSKDSSKSEI